MQRRTFLGGALLAGAGIAASADRNIRAIKVTAIERFRLVVQEGRYGWVIVRVHTDAGLSGLGDASESGRGDPAVAKIDEYAEWWKGRSIFEIEPFRQMAYAQRKGRGRDVACAFSGIEQALYDIQSQAFGVPMNALFGGKLHDRVRNYANINRGSKSRTPAGFEPTARSAVDAGFDAVKVAPFDRMPKDAAGMRARTDEGIASVRLMREIFGDQGDVLVEGHKNFDLERGLAVAPRLESFNVFWFEEAIGSLDDMAKLRAATEIPIAGGEGLFGVAQALEYLRIGAVDILMPDIKWCAGALELKKIAAMCEGAGVSVAPHGPMGPIGSMAAAQVCSTLPNFSILEYAHGDAPWRFELTDPPEPLEKGGMLRIPDTPGLGYKLNMKTVERRKIA